MRISGILSILLLLVACSESETTQRDRFLFLGNEAIADKDWDKAIHYFDNAIRVDDNYSLAYNNRGVARVNKGHVAEAILDYNEALAIDSVYYECLGNRAHAYERVRRYENALSDWSKLTHVFADSAFLFLSKGLVASKLQSYDQAEEAFLQALDLDPSDDEAMVNLGVLKYYEGQLDSAAQWLRRALTFNPENGHAYNALNQIAIAEDDWAIAMEHVTRAIDLEPDNPYFLNNRGYTYLLMDSLALGIADINQSILLDAENMWAFRNKGIFYLLSGSAETALRYFEQVEESRAFVDELQAYKGQAYMALDRLADACEAWKKGKDQKSKRLLKRHCM